MLRSSLRFPLLCAAVAAMLPVLAHAGDDGQPTHKCRYARVATLPIRYVGAAMEPAIDGTIDDTPATLLIDTGSYDTFLTRTGVEKHDLTMFATGSYDVGVGGYSRVYAARVRELGLGPAKTHKSFELPVTGSMSWTPSYDAVLGAPSLFEFDLEVSLKDKVLKLYSSENCEHAVLKFWKENAISVPFTSASVSEPQPHIEVTLNGHKLDAIIDTGASVSLITREAAESAGIDVDGPDVKRLGDVTGIGSNKVPHWSTTVKSLSIGDETIRQGEIGIIDPRGQGGWGMLLGQDFLHAHRVLFAMEQHKLYLAYLGGEVFSQKSKSELTEQEADAGNADAQYALARRYSRDHNTKDAQAWLEKAAANGSAHAGLSLGGKLVASGHVADGIARMRAALDQLPAERYGELDLYLARVLNDQTELGKTELAARIAKHHDDSWPAPITAFYLGKIDADELLKQAEHGDDEPAILRCQAKFYIDALQTAKTDKERGRAALDANLDCSAKSAQKTAAR
jgi:hypothetical protein